MSSTRSVDFSVRQNKAIERAVIFDGLGRIVRELRLKQPVFVGFGSVWFVDFLMAHRQLGITTMYSIENDEVVATRATFNKPYKSLEVIKGEALEVIRSLLKDKELSRRPWIVWLDYDKPMKRNYLRELCELAMTLPYDSVLLTTFRVVTADYDAVNNRVSRLRDMFGNSLSPNVDDGEVACWEKLSQVIANAVNTMLISRTLADQTRPEFLPAFSVTYKDDTPMLTVGGLLPSKESKQSAEQLIGSNNWPGRPNKPIVIPPLTVKEVAAIQGLLPDEQPPSRDDIKLLGFDLEENAIELFCDHYLRYPIYAQLMR